MGRRHLRRANGHQRGLTMVIALIVVAVLLVVAVVLLSNAFGAASAESSIRAKIAAFDAAEAGINRAVEELDRTGGQSEACGDRKQGLSGPQLADGGSYVWCIEYNGMLHGQEKHVAAKGTSAWIDVPKTMIYAWATGTAVGGGRGVTVEALVAPSRGLSLPGGAIAAGGDVDARGTIGIYASSPGGQDASVHANGNIYEARPPQAIEGNTYAVGVDQMLGNDGQYHASADPVAMPNGDQIAGDEQNARAAALGGAPIMAPASGSSLINGDAFLEGDLIVQNGTITFEHGQSVFIDGDLCVVGAGKVVNDGSVIWVSGAVSTAGSTSGYSVTQGTAGSLIAFGSDTSRACANAIGRYAVALEASGIQDIGLVYAPNGSIDLLGSGTVVGSLVSGKNLVLDGTSGNAIQLDRTANHPIPTYDFRIVSYMEY